MSSSPLRIASRLALITAALGTPIGGCDGSSTPLDAGRPPDAAAADTRADGLAGDSRAADRGDTTPDAGACPSGERYCAGGCARCPAQATATACAGAACEATACAGGDLPCGGLCAPSASHCACPASPRPVATEWMNWPPLPDATETTSFALADELVLDARTCLMWQRAVPLQLSNWLGAKAYCEQLELAGYTDWRLPTAVELKSIVDRSTDSPAINTIVFPDTPATAEENWYWTATPTARDAAYAWIVGFLFGVTSPNDIGSAVYARCVR